MDQKVKTITTRTLLREYRSVKQDLLRGSVDTYIIPVEEGRNLELKVQKPKRNGTQIAEVLKSMKKPINVTRHPGLFDDLHKNRRTV